MNRSGRHVYRDFRGVLMGLYYRHGSHAVFNTAENPIIDFCRKCYGGNVLVFATHRNGGVSFYDAEIGRSRSCPAHCCETLFSDKITGSLCLWQDDKIWLVTDSGKSISIISAPCAHAESQSPLSSYNLRISSTVNVKELKSDEKITKMCITKKKIFVLYQKRS